METADAFVRLGLRDLNFTWVNSDDCWMIKERNQTNGAQIANASKFPNGIRKVADYIRGLDLHLAREARRENLSFCVEKQQKSRKMKHSGERDCGFLDP